MSRIEKVIFIKNVVETLGYFSEQIAMEMEWCGIDTYFIDHEHLIATIEELGRFWEEDKTAFLTFNFIGLGDRDLLLNENGSTIWEKYKIRCINILVEHPLYFHEKLIKSTLDMKIVCIDQKHQDFMRKYYPGVPVTFMPHGGNIEADIVYGFLQNQECSYGIKYRDYEKIKDYEHTLIPFQKRKYDLVFIGNYTSVQRIYKPIKRIDKTYASLCKNILDGLIENPEEALEDIAERQILEELMGMRFEERRKMISEMHFLDQSIRTYYRNKVFQTIADADIQINFFGANWSEFTCKKPWNVKWSPERISSADCVRIVRDARFSLNVLPWYKCGAHERIYTAMLAKTVCVTDSNVFLEQEFQSERDLLFYSLKNLDQLPGQLEVYRDNPDIAQEIAEAGYQKARGIHSWKERARFLIDYMS